MTTIFQVFDLKEAALSEAKQQARERRYLDGGICLGPSLESLLLMMEWMLERVVDSYIFSGMAFT